MEALTHVLYPAPAGTNMSDMTAVKRYVATLPPLAFALVLAGWALGTLLGTWAASRLARTPVAGYLVGAVLLAAGVANAFMIPQPLWFSAVSFAIFIGATLLATSPARRAAVPVTGSAARS
jgi:hypothetical protein